MPEVTVKQFAATIDISVELLQEQLIESGLLKKNADELITDAEKSALLDYLRSKHGKGSSESKNITLRRKTAKEITVPVNTQSRRKIQSKTVNVEFRKKRTYVKRSALEKKQAEAESAEAESAEDKVTATKEAQLSDSIKDTHNIESKADSVELTELHSETAQIAIEPEPLLSSADKVSADTVSADKVDSITKDVETVAIVDVAAEPIKKETSAPIKSPAPKKKKSPQSKFITDKKSKDKNKSKDKETLYGRQKLHVASGKSGRRKQKQRRSGGSIPKAEIQHGFEKPTQPIIREVRIAEHISVSELAQKMSVKATEVIQLIMELGITATVNQVLDQETAALIVEEMGHDAKLINESALEDDLLRVVSQDASKQVHRAPVVTVMGHVDHGKTSLLDYIRSSQIADGEAGGITQHIGAYVVESSRSKITFLDTPGHEAFSAMRARGASVTDIIVLVVAADDGVMPQTKEAVEHAKSSEVPIIVAINKIDKAEADIEHVKQGLSNLGVISEEWGGDTQFVNISSKTGEGINSLLDSISLQAELLELRAMDTGLATGVLIEARLDKGRGPVATILVRSGSLNKGDIILSGKEFGHVRAMFDHSGNELLSAAGPSMPVEIIGLSGVPNAGDEMIVVSDEKKAREISSLRKSRSRESKLAKQHAAKLQTVMNTMDADECSIFNIMIKADTHGSTEAIVNALNRLSTDEVAVNIVSSGVGGIRETDINLALTSKAMVVGFNVRAGTSARKLAEEESLDIRYYSIIYDLINDVKALMSGMLEPELQERIIGIAQVKDVFPSPKFGDIAGCIIITGIVRRDSPIRVLRDDVVIYEGELESLRRFKDDVNEVKSGVECGIGVKNYNNVMPGDQIEVFERLKVERTI